MSATSTTLSRPLGRALIIAGPPCRVQPLSVMQRLGYTCAEMDDPYAAMLEICRRPLVYRCIVMSLNSLYKEELTLITTVKRRFPHIEIWLTQIEGRQSTLAEAMRLGADGLLADDGLHRTTTEAQAAPALPQVFAAAGPVTYEPQAPQAQPAQEAFSGPAGEDDPVLTADELRALLQEQPSATQGDTNT
jgi:hypothetical protein